MQILPPDPMAQGAPKHLAAIDPTLFAAPSKIFRTPMSVRSLPPGPTTQRSAEHHEKLHWPV